MDVCVIWKWALAESTLHLILSIVINNFCGQTLFTPSSKDILQPKLAQTSGEV